MCNIVKFVCVSSVHIYKKHMFTCKTCVNMCSAIRTVRYGPISRCSSPYTLASPELYDNTTYSLHEYWERSQVCCQYWLQWRCDVSLHSVNTQQQEMTYVCNTVCVLSGLYLQEAQYCVWFVVQFGMNCASNATRKITKRRVQTGVGQ